MKLKEIEIFSYRSILNQVIPMEQSCIGLVGLNESGKSNILSAVRMLDPDYSPSLKDRSKLNDSLPKVRFGFEISLKTNLEAIEFCKSSLAESPSIPYSSIASKISVKFYHTYRQLELLKDSTYKKSTRYVCEFSIDTNRSYYKLKEKDQSSIPADMNIIKINNDDYSLSKLQIIAKDDIPESIATYFELANDDYVKKLISPLLYQFFEKRLPLVVFWQYDQQYLLPSEITYTNFIADDDPYTNCTPLYNIIMLSKRLGVSNEDDLVDKISEWKTDSSLRRRDANIITDDLNQYIKRIWPEYDQQIRIELEEMKITIHIHDPHSSVGNFYDMESRSQGFKTFISFMLTTAAEIDTDQINNFILLLDEPETHLHPSGARFMREELLKLSKNNYIIYATHSIFMIDRTNINRHFIVKKESESTTVSHVDRNNFIQESVIYEALGTTVDEFSIKNKNIVFEGEMDLILFKYLLNECFSKRGNALLEYELHDAGGTKNIVSFFKNKIIPRDSEWIIILDNDPPGKSVPSDVAKSSLETNNIHYVYYSSLAGKELEDLLPEVMIKDAISRTESTLAYSPKIGFVIDSQKTISRNVEEYKHKNMLQTNQSFEVIFKESLLSLISEKLKGIKETTISGRWLAFQCLFPEYCSAVRPVFEMKGMKFEEGSS